MQICCFCGAVINGHGSNPYPECTEADAVCCDECNLQIVVPARIKYIENYKTYIK